MFFVGSNPTPSASSMRTVLFGLDIAQQRVPFDEVVSRTRFAEELGFAGVWGFDHFEPMYGEGPGECFEAMTTLAALAGMTETVRLGILVTGVTYRHPSVLAAQALTVDHASHGRLDLSFGAAWYEAEHRKLGLDFPSLPRRFDLLEDTLEIVTRLFTGDVVSYDGRRVSLAGARMRPLPVQSPRPPIWIGGSGRKRTLPLVARFADWWHTWPSPAYRELSAEVDRLAESAGRDGASIGRASSLSLSEPWDEVRRALDGRVAEGVRYLVCGWPEQGRSRIEEFVAEVLPTYR